MLGARSVAVVGASADPTKFGARPAAIAHQRRVQRRHLPVNPGRRHPRPEVLSERRGHPRFARPRRHRRACRRRCSECIEEAADKGAAGVFVISGGFKESGRADLEEAVVVAVRSRGMRLFGPNTQGIAYAANQLSAVFWPVLTVPGPVAVVGQSGTVVAAHHRLGTGRGPGRERVGQPRQPGGRLRVRRAAFPSRRRRHAVGCAVSGGRERRRAASSRRSRTSPAACPSSS